jgi:3,2-trans-enoyl-CoA isomerase
MIFVRQNIQGGIAELVLERGKVNALNEQVVDELSQSFRELADDSRVRGILLAGTGKFFSFGFDVPEFLGVAKEAFAGYLEKFTALYRDVFAHPKPVVAAINGHAVAGGCMLATACDTRVMVKEDAKIGLNEIGFGSSLFAGSLEMLRFWVGARRAQEVAYSGTLYTADQALALGLVDATAPEVTLRDEARRWLDEHIDKPPAAFRSIKLLLRQPILEEIQRSEAASIREFVEIWYSPEMRRRLEKIKIHA